MISDLDSTVTFLTQFWRIATNCARRAFCLQPAKCSDRYTLDKENVSLHTKKMFQLWKLFFGSNGSTNVFIRILNS